MPPERRSSAYDAVDTRLRRGRILMDVRAMGSRGHRKKMGWFDGMSRSASEDWEQLG